MYFCFTDYWLKSNNQLDDLACEIKDANNYAFKIMSEDLKHLALGMSTFLDKD